MNQCIRIICFLIALSASTTALGQDTLPKFSVRNLGNNRIVIGWVNQFPNIKQISIQRSHDSLRNFKTILSVADPKAVQNGFADTKAPTEHMFYRLFYVLEGGAYYFTATKKPFLDTARTTVDIVPEAEKEKVEPAAPEVKKPEGFIPSSRIFTNRHGYISINLPDADKKKYSVKFFEEDDSFLFELKDIKKTELTLDKTNFIHAGWFKFELYNDEKLVERHKFYLPKDF